MPPLVDPTCETPDLEAVDPINLNTVFNIDTL